MSCRARLLIVVLTFASFFEIVSAIPIDERQALIAFYNAFDGRRWFSNQNWLGPAGTEGTWHGITVTDGHVTKIRLPANGLRGPVPSEIGNLPYLEELDLSGGWWSWEGTGLNNLTALPPEIGRLSRLRSLNLGYNRLTAFPDEMAGLRSLVYLNLQANYLGSLPSVITRLPAVEELLLDWNRLVALPASIGDMTALKRLSLGGNRLTGLPSEIGNLQNLTHLDLTGNQISTLPPVLGQLSNLRDLGLGGNPLSQIPVELAALPGLTTLTFDLNQLSRLPSGISALKSVRELVVEYGLTDLGEIPEMTGLRILTIRWTPISSLPESFKNLINLEELDLSRNKLSTIPPVIGRLTNLHRLELGGNPLEGSLPASLGNLTLLKELTLADPSGKFLQLSGALPPELGNMISLETLALAGNFTGPIPAELGRLVNLKHLRLYGSFSGIPPELGQLSNLLELEIEGDDDYFKLVKAPFPLIPREIGRLKNLVHLSLAGSFTSIPPELMNLTQLEHLQLAGSEIPEPIPDSIGQLTNLTYLNLAGNGLVGPIPEEIGNLERLEIVDMSHNRLEGTIPLGLLRTGSALYRSINLSANRLAGPLPAGLQPMEGSNLRVDLKWNALYPVGLDAFAFIGFHHQGDFGGTQSYGPVDLAAAGMGDTVRLSWSPISYQADSGGYQILYRQREDEPWTVYGMTNSKTATSFTVTGLETGRDYYFALRTGTYPHANNRNTVVGEPGNIAWAGTTPYSETWLPLYPDGPEGYVGIGITNVWAVNLQGQIQAFSGSGSAAAFPLNPAPLALVGGRQQAAVDSQIFGWPPPAQPWLARVRADHTPVTLCMQGGPGLLDGTAGITGIHRALYFPRVYQGAGVLAGKAAVTRVNLVNPGSSPVQVRLQLAGPQIDTAGTATVRTIAPGGLVSETLAELFGAALPVSEAYIEARVLEGDGCAGVAVVTGGEGTSLFVGPGVPPSGFNSLSVPQVASGPGISTSIRLINIDPAARIVSLRLYPDGGDSLRASLEIPAGSLVEKDLADLFQLPDTLTAAALIVSADGTGVTGDVLVYGPSLSWATAVPLAGRSGRESILGYVANGLGVFTGLAIFNPGDEATETTVEVLSPDGSSVGKASVNLAPKGRIAQMTAALVPSSAERVGGYIRVTATQPVVVQEVFAGSSLEYMSAVPPVILK